MAKVLALPELVELILIQVGACPKDANAKQLATQAEYIFLAQRVCKLWRDAIARSNDIQVLLMRKCGPLPVLPSEYHYLADYRYPWRNLNLWRHLNDYTPCYSQPLAVNEFLRLACDCEPKAFERHSPPKYRLDTFRLDPNDLAKGPPTASYMDSFLTMPPATTAAMYMWNEDPFWNVNGPPARRDIDAEGWDLACSVRDNGGLTFRHVFNAAVAIMRPMANKVMPKSCTAIIQLASVAPLEELKKLHRE